MATRKLNAKKPAKPPLVIRAFSLTTKHDTLLSEIAGAASDRLGWTISGSAVVRALLSFTDSQDSGWISQELFPRIEQEIDAGRVWGTKK
jgi:hypothetical protein